MVSTVESVALAVRMAIQEDSTEIPSWREEQAQKAAESAAAGQLRRRRNSGAGGAARLQA